MRALRTLLISLILPVSTVLFSVQAIASYPALESSLDAESLSEARRLYSEALQLISKGKLSDAENITPRLRNYVLYPYLELELLKAQINNVSRASIDAYLDLYGDTPVARQIKTTWLRRLRKEHDWTTFLTYYQGYKPSGMQCDYAIALHANNRAKEAIRVTEKLWLSPTSLPKSCDRPVRKWLAGLSAKKRDAQYWQRIFLALNANQSKLAGHLLTKVKGGEAYRELLARPSALYKRGPNMRANEKNRSVAIHTLKRLARTDFAASNDLWHEISGPLKFSARENHQLRDALARQIIAGDASYARDWLRATDPEFQDPYLTEWQIRLALKGSDWPNTQLYISKLPVKHWEKSSWQYWWARADIAIHDEITKDAAAKLEHLASERGYYSFLAADILQRDYQLGAQRNVDENIVPDIAKQSDILRAYELFWHGDQGNARAEWARAMRKLNTPQQLAAAQVAHNWQWSNQSINTAIRAGEWNDLSLRFPTPFRKTFTDTAKKENIELPWIYAISRQESAFAEDARSRVGARGIMQIMPSTAKSLARKMSLTGFNTNTLLQADANIPMGGYYLGQLLEQFNGNRILATAAYNAGPNRIERFLKKQDGSYPADIWIENLPYGETRKYIKNVLAFGVIYGKALDHSDELIKEAEYIIAPRNVDSLVKTAAGTP
ncbi:MAG: transglycosylase SLT domain-containing protein [Spongiibacteraceae bacterium]